VLRTERQPTRSHLHHCQAVRRLGQKQTWQLDPLSNNTISPMLAAVDAPPLLLLPLLLLLLLLLQVGHS
jgi:hypothetical protein